MVGLLASLCKRGATIGTLAVLAATGPALAQTAPLPALPVGTMAVDSRPVTGALSVVGRAEAIERVEIRARVDGFLEEVAFTEGHRSPRATSSTGSRGPVPGECQCRRGRGRDAPRRKGTSPTCSSPAPRS